MTSHSVDPVLCSVSWACEEDPIPEPGKTNGEIISTPLVHLTSTRYHKMSAISKIINQKADDAACDFNYAHYCTVLPTFSNLYSCSSLFLQKSVRRSVRFVLFCFVLNEFFIGDFYSTISREQEALEVLYLGRLVR